MIDSVVEIYYNKRKTMLDKHKGEKEMKKRISRMLSILLASVLILSTGEVAHAEETSALVEAESQVEEVPELEEEKQTESAGEALEAVKEAEIDTEIEAKGNVVGSIPVKYAVTGTETPDVGIITYNSGNVKGDYCGYSQKVTFSGVGTLGMAVNNDAASSGYIDFGVFYDANMTNPVDSVGYSSNGETYGRVFKIPKAGTYYIGLYSSKGYNTTYSYYAAVAAIFYSGADRTLSNGKQIVVGQKDEQVNYFKFTAINSGYITTYSDETAEYFKVALCNSSKKALSGYSYLRYNPTYGVKKGVTYYFKVASGYNSDGGYTFKVTNSKITEKSGSKKSKAVTIKKNSTKKGTILAGSSQADWYKFKLTGSKSVKIYFKGRTNDQLKITVYKGSKNIGSSTLYYYDTSRTLSSIGKLSKGTYYIKIQRVNSKSSGWYSLKWK